MSHIMYVAIGGALGSVSRYLISIYIIFLNKNPNHNFLAKIINSCPTQFPLANFCVNVFGCIFAGMAYYLTIKDFENIDPDIRNFIFFGFLGGFTTFSAFSLDFFRLFNAGQAVAGLTYVVSTMFFSILSVFAGFYACKSIFQ